MVKRALLLTLITAPALAHPGDHTFARVVVHQNEVDAELDLPASALSSLDANGDFLITPEEGQQRKERLQTLWQQGFEFSSDGVVMPPSQLDVLPRSLWLNVPDDLVERANQSVTLRARFRWPWDLQHLRVRYQWFAPSPQADCTLQVSAFGNTRTTVLHRDSAPVEVGRSRPWLGIFWGACSPWLWLAGAGAVARARGRGLYALITGLLLGAAGLPRSPWTSAVASGLLACWPSPKPVVLIGLAGLWLMLPADDLVPAAGALGGLLFFGWLGRRLQAGHASLCFGLAALLSFLA